MALETEQHVRETIAPETGAAPERTCLVTRAHRAPDELIRFVLGPDHAVVPDLKRKLPGRGVWVGLSKALVAQAVKKQLFARGLKDKAVAAPDLPDLVETLLKRDALQGLALANKAGLIVTGFAKVEAAIAAGALAALVHAADGAPDGKRKLRQALRRRYGEQSPPDFNLFAMDEIEAALGRDKVVHLALRAGAAAKVFLASARRYALYRGDGEDDACEGDENVTAPDEAWQASEAPGANGRNRSTGEESWDA
ncbi:MAG TPA: RNA-binding protein [Rhodoblastus sp.]|nr:RNA-binding protein [Rhodoblastus sp.]